MIRRTVLTIVTFSLISGACGVKQTDNATDGGDNGGRGGSAGSGGASGTAGSSGSSSGGTSGDDAGGGTAGSSGSGSGGINGDGGAAGTTGEGGTSGTGATAGTGGTGGGAENLLLNPGFEEVVLDPWKGNANGVLDTAEPRTGAQHLTLGNAFTTSSPFDVKETQQRNLLTSGTYTFRVWIKKTGTGALTELYLESQDFNHLNADDDRTKDILQTVTGSYQQFTLSGIPVTSETGSTGNCTVAVVAAGDANAKVYVDDATLTKDP